MQKFKIHRKTLNSLCEKEDFITKYDDRLLPEFLILEGELLEGGTVECCVSFKLGGVHMVDCHTVEKCQRCKNGCLIAVDGNSNGSCECPCHNKKEDVCTCDDWNFIHSHTGKKYPFKEDFNRETPKEMKAVPMPIFQAGDSVPKEEVKLPEMLSMKVFEPNAMNIMAKINQILTYLASKENK